MHLSTLAAQGRYRTAVSRDLPARLHTDPKGVLARTLGTVGERHINKKNASLLVESCLLTLVPHSVRATELSVFGALEQQDY